MKLHKFICIPILACLALSALLVPADTVVQSDNRHVTGQIIQTNGNEILILTPCAAFRYPLTDIKDVQPEPTKAADTSGANSLPDFQTTILSLSGKLWATNLTPIPATVIDKGILKNVPYSSFHCGSDYEVNVYGDPQNPAGIEIGVYRKLLDDDSAKDNCVNFMSGVLRGTIDKLVVRDLDRSQDLRTVNDLTFEITPPTADDAYGGWWISVYSETRLNLARASDANMKQITTSATNGVQAGDFASWSTDDMKQARHQQLNTITFTDSSGTLISDATVVRTNDGVSLIWETDRGNTVGLVKLEDLPEPLRVRYGYDEAKSKAADELAKEKKEEWQQEVAAARQADAARMAAAQAASSGYSESPYDGGGYSGAGMVYVHGYYRSNGTYVHSYYRSYPRR